MLVASNAAKATLHDLLARERWLTAPQVAEQARAGTTRSDPYEYASRLRRERRLFGTRFRGSYRYPTFQFVPDTGQPRAGLAEIVPLLPSSHDGWTAALWLFEPTGMLAGARPADVSAQDPDLSRICAKRDSAG